MSTTIRVAVAQMCSGSCLKTNARAAAKAIDKAVQEKAKVLFLPEAADFIARDPPHAIKLADRTGPDFLQPLQDKVKSYYNPSLKDSGIFVAVGVHEPATHENKGKKVQNNQVWISNTGEILHRYQKIHLFDVNIADGPVLKESDLVEPGNKILSPFPVGHEKPCSEIKIGFAICYDMRFPEMAAQLRHRRAHIITYPSAFTTTTGEAHWKALGRARAIDTQCYVVMAAQCGQHDVTADLTQKEKDDLNYLRKRETYGSALIIGPWGDIMAEASNYRERAPVDEEGDFYEVVCADVNKEYLVNLRKEMPVAKHRRPVVYHDSYPEH